MISGIESVEDACADALITACAYGVKSSGQRVTLAAALARSQAALTRAMLRAAHEQQGGKIR